MILKYTLGDADAGKTVLTILRRELNISASMVRRLKNTQGIYSDGKKVYTTYSPRPGETVSADISLAEPPCDVVPQDGKIDILFENEGLIAVNKPSGLITHPTHAKYDGTLANYVSGFLLKVYGDGRCHSVNRLDRDTSGIVLFAKNSYMKDRASRSLKADGAEKYYLSLVCGAMPNTEGVIRLPIKRLREGELRRVAAPDGQEAVTHYRVLKTAVICGQTVSLLRLRLETGRTHQIRVHCLCSGCPLLGDIMYTTPESETLSEKLGISKQALHAESLYFTEPLSGAPVSITAPLCRRDMNDIINML